MLIKDELMLKKGVFTFIILYLTYYYNLSALEIIYTILHKMSYFQDNNEVEMGFFLWYANFFDF